MNDLKSAIERVEAKVKDLQELYAESLVEPLRSALIAQARTAVEKQHEVAAKIGDVSAFKSRVSSAAAECADLYAEWVRDKSIADLDSLLVRRRIGLSPNVTTSPTIFQPFSRVMDEAGFEPEDGMGRPSRDWGSGRDWRFYVSHQSSRTFLPTFDEPSDKSVKDELEILSELKRELRKEESQSSKAAQLDRWDSA